MWLSQREHSRRELGQKLHRWLDAASREDVGTPVSSADDIEPLLNALVEAGHLSDDRFVESRIHVRAGRFGNRRIEIELRQHGVELDPESRASLAASETERARRVRHAKFGRPAADPADRARQARFLAGRGFSSDAIKRALTTDTGDD